MSMTTVSTAPPTGVLDGSTETADDAEVWDNSTDTNGLVDLSANNYDRNNNDDDDEEEDGGSGLDDEPAGEFDESELFWGQQGLQRLQEQAFDFSIQRWYEEPKKCPKFPPPPVTDLQNLDLDRPSMAARTSGCPPRLAGKTSRKPPFSSIGIHVEVPTPMKTAPTTTTTTSVDPKEIAVPESDIFDRNFSHHYAYNQVCITCPFHCNNEFCRNIEKKLG